MNAQLNIRSHHTAYDLEDTKKMVRKKLNLYWAKKVTLRIGPDLVPPYEYFLGEMMRFGD